MSVSSTRNRNFYRQQIMAIVICWTLIGMIDALHTHVICDGLILRRTKVYQFSQLFLLGSISGLFSGLISGSLLVKYLRRWSRERPFGISILINTSVTTVLNIAITAITYQILIRVEGGLSTYHDDAHFQAITLLRSPYFVKSIFLWVIVSLGTIIVLNVNEKYGQGVLLKLLVGHYHKPREEERVFMFVDIRSSTEIAEKLGHVKFFRLLNDFFTDITDPVILTKGEIYQYVGDEVVISWSMKKGIQYNNCIRCFFLLQDAIEQAAARYQERYGLVPEFKVGLHTGIVTTGEIGIIKKDIVYSGDVMNTTSRIQSVCNKFRVSILMSKRILNKLNLPANLYPLKRVGVIELKGKKEKVELFTFEKSILPPPKTSPYAFT